MFQKKRNQIGEENQFLKLINFYVDSSFWNLSLDPKEREKNKLKEDWGKKKEALS